MTSDFSQSQSDQPTGNVIPTPEAGPLTPPSMRDHFTTTTTQSTPEGTVSLAATAARGPAPGEPDAAAASAEKNAPSFEETAHDLGERLRPVVAAAEEVAAKALDFSAKGLSKLADALEERRRDRDNTPS